MTIKNRLPTLRSAVEAMVAGLRDEDRGFFIDMDTYGDKENGEYFGCAATATVLYAVPEACVQNQTRRSSLRAMYPDLGKFESAIDYFRVGVPESLLRFYGLPPQEEPCDWYLDYHNWEEQLSLIEQWLDKWYPVP